MPRAKIWGYIFFIISLLLLSMSIYSIASGYQPGIQLEDLNENTFHAIAIPIGLVSFFIIATGFWIGYTILTIKVVPPMPEIVEKKDYSKIKAFFLCLTMLALAVLLGYGIYIRSFWALAIPALLISLVIIGAIMWVSIAIITTRKSLPED